VRIAFNADNPGKWLIRSTVLEHMESGVLSWFEVQA
jgi:FtsP/CotA-like multicopper oxidase with cupredoxin domain